MNTNPLAKRILCYGDSLVRGRIPDSYERWPVNERWTWVMQDMLWKDFDVIEEGLRGRNTHHDSPKWRDRNGLKSFYSCLLSQFPLDLIIVFLGTNNLHASFNDSIDDILAAFDEYKQLANDGVKEFHTSMPKILLVSPPFVDSTLNDDDKFTSEAEAKSHQMADAYKAYADKLWRYFFDAANVVGAGIIDGLHLSSEQNGELGKKMAECVRSIFIAH